MQPHQYPPHDADVFLHLHCSTCAVLGILNRTACPITLSSSFYSILSNLTHHLTFWTALCRAGREGECRESETSVMCKDFLRMGYSNFIVDPAVRLAYHPGEARQLYTSKVTVTFLLSAPKLLRACPHGA